METDCDEDNFGLFQAECAGCELFTQVDEVGLCGDCAGKLERDFIRKRNWAYSATAFGVPPEKREELRTLVVKEYGEALELIAPNGKEREAGKGKTSSSAHTKKERKKR